MTGPVARPAKTTAPTTGRGRGDSGAANSVAVALLAPLFVVLAFAAVQAALWSHARTEARVVARDTAALVARSGMDAGDARSAAASVLRHDTELAGVEVSVSVDGDFIDKHDASSGTAKTTQAAANVAGGVAAAMGFGGMRFGKTRKFEFDAKPGNYEEGAAKAAGLANDVLIGQINALK